MVENLWNTDRVTTLQTNPDVRHLTKYVRETRNEMVLKRRRGCTMTDESHKGRKRSSKREINIYKFTKKKEPTGQERKDWNKSKDKTRQFLFKEKPDQQNHELTQCDQFSQHV